MVGVHGGGGGGGSDGVFRVMEAWHCSQMMTRGVAVSSESSGLQ